MLDVCFRRPSDWVNSCSMMEICYVLKLQDRKVAVFRFLLEKAHAQWYSVLATISNKTCWAVKWTELHNCYILDTFKRKCAGYCLISRWHSVSAVKKEHYWHKIAISTRYNKLYVYLYIEHKDKILCSLLASWIAKSSRRLPNRVCEMGPSGKRTNNNLYQGGIGKQSVVVPRSQGILVFHFYAIFTCMSKVYYHNPLKRKKIHAKFS